MFWKGVSWSTLHVYRQCASPYVPYWPQLHLPNRIAIPYVHRALRGPSQADALRSLAHAMPPGSHAYIRRQSDPSAQKRHPGWSEMEGDPTVLLMGHHITCFETCTREIHSQPALLTNQH